MTAVLVLLAALLVAAGAQPAVLPGSDVNANYSAVCQTRYRFPAGYALDSCGRCSTTSNAGATCRCDATTQPCVVCPEASPLVGLTLCRLDLGGYSVLPLDSDRVEEAFQQQPSSAAAPNFYALHYPGRVAPRALDDATLGLLDCFCVWAPLPTSVTAGTGTSVTPCPPLTSTTAPIASTTPSLPPSTLVPTTTATSTTTATTTTMTTVSSTTTTPVSSTMAPSTTSGDGSSTSASETLTSATSAVSSTTAQTATTAPAVCGSTSLPCAGGLCGVSDFVCVDGVCGCRLSCAQVNPAVQSCAVGGCVMGGTCALLATEPPTCGCNTPARVSQSTDNTDLLIIIGVPVAIAALVVLALAGYYFGQQRDETMKHKDQ